MNSANLIVSENAIYCYCGKGKQLRRHSVIDPDKTDDQLSDYLHRIRVNTVFVLTDLSEEEFTVVSIPVNKAKNTRANLQTIIHRQFSGSEYTLSNEIPASVLDRSSGNKSVLVAGLRKCAILQHLLQCLINENIIVAGVFNLAVLLDPLLSKEMKFKSGSGSDYRFLVSTEDSDKWRFSLYKGKSLLISRKAVSQSNDAWVDIYNEIRGTLKFARRNGYITVEIKPQFYFAGPLPPLTVIGMHAQKKLNFRFPLHLAGQKSLYDLCAKRFSFFRCQNARYKTQSLRKPYYLLQLAHLSVSAAIVAIASSVFLVASQYDKILNTQGLIKHISLTNTQLSRSVDDMSIQPGEFRYSAIEVELLVNAFEQLQVEADLRKVLLALAQALTEHTSVYLTRVRWRRYSTESENRYFSDKYTSRENTKTQEYTEVLASLSIPSTTNLIMQQRLKHNFLTSLSSHTVEVEPSGSPQSTAQYVSGGLGAFRGPNQASDYKFNLSIKLQRDHT